MIWFWMAAAALAGGAALLVMSFAQGAARRGVQGGGAAENPALAVHRRHLSEIDDLADRGLIGESEKAAARAEAGRRLLSTAALGAPAETAGSRTSRLIASGAAVAAGGLALILYMTIGASAAPDQSYRARVAAWKAADPATLDAPRMAAVLRTIADNRPTDPQVFSFLGRADMGAGDPFAAERAFARAARLDPRRADYRTELGEAWLAAADGKPSPEAMAAFRQALALDPEDMPARYALGRLEIAGGDRVGGLGFWKSVLADLPADDPRRAPLSTDIARIAAGGPLEAPAPPAAALPTDASQFIRGMVASLAAKLAANPDDPEGWARLVRSYGVLHDAPAQADALARARRQFVGKPDALKTIEAEAQAHPA